MTLLRLVFLSSSLTFRRTHILADKLGRLCYLCFSFIFLIVLWCTYLLTVLFTMLNLGEAGVLLSSWGGYVIEDLGWNLTGWPHACCWCCNFRCWENLQRNNSERSQSEVERCVWMDCLRSEVLRAASISTSAWSHPSVCWSLSILKGTYNVGFV